MSWQSIDDVLRSLLSRRDCMVSLDIGPSCCYCSTLHTPSSNSTQQVTNFSATLLRTPTTRELQVDHFACIIHCRSARSCHVQCAPPGIPKAWELQDVGHNVRHPFIAVSFVTHSCAALQASVFSHFFRCCTRRPVVELVPTSKMTRVLLERTKNKKHFHQRLRRTTVRSTLMLVAGGW